MKVRDDWHFEDGVSGLALRVIPGQRLDRLRISLIRHGLPPLTRDFWFTKDGEFDGTGCEIAEAPAASAAK